MAEQQLPEVVAVRMSGREAELLAEYLQLGPAACSHEALEAAAQLHAALVQALSEGAATMA